MSTIAAIVGSNSIVLVEGEKNSDDTVSVIKDETFTLENGDRHVAYRKMSQRLKDRFSEGVDKVVVKASSGGQFAAKTGVLHAAELRGVLLSSVPSGMGVAQRHKKTVSTSKTRKFDDYLKDDNFFEARFDGIELRKGSREAAFFILNEFEQE